MESDDYKLISLFGIVSVIAGGALLFTGISGAGELMAGGGCVAALVGFAGTFWKK